MHSKIDQLIDSIERLRRTIENSQLVTKKITVNDALAMLINVGPNATEIAKRLGINRRMLYRPEFKRFQDAIEIAREGADRGSFPVHGCVNDGILEAWGKPGTDD